MTPRIPSSSPTQWIEYPLVWFPSILTGQKNGSVNECNQVLTIPNVLPLADKNVLNMKYG
jgi:hypothetical protein